MPYKKNAIIVSVISLILVLTFSVVSCGIKTSTSQNTSQESAAGSAATTKAAVAAPTSSPSSLTSQAEQKSQSSSLPEDPAGSNISLVPEISVIGALTGDGQRSSILLITEGVEKITMLTDGLYNNSGPVFSPNKDKIAFYSNIDGDYDIYVMNPDGSDMKNITSNDANDYAPKWSTDSKKICYQSDRSGNSEIYIINADGTEDFKVTQSKAENYSPVWFPGGDKILYTSDESGNFDIYSIGTDGSGKKKLTNDEYFEENLSFSPDGAKVLYAAGLIDSTAYEIFTLDINTLKINKLTDSMSYSRMPLWAKCQGQGLCQNLGIIIFNSDMDGYSEIYSLNSDGSGLKNLTSNDIEDYLLGLSPSGSAIFYQSTDENGETTLKMYDMGTSRETIILNGRADFEILKEKESDPNKIFEFIDLNILIAGSSFADEIIDFAIEFSENELIPFTDEYAKSTVQEKIWNYYEGTTDLAILAGSNDKELSGLAQETLNRKYKLVSTEGFICPIVDYLTYKNQYGIYLSEQMNAYIDIMAAESEKPSITDGGITISLEEFVNKIISLYDFEEKYGGFARIYRIVNRLNSFLWVYMGGIDNTPVFKFDGNILPERLSDFKANAAKYKGTRFGDKLTEYLELLKSENYIRTEKVADYIDNLTFY
jgi:Tol biopolymer transport system component